MEWMSFTVWEKSLEFQLGFLNSGDEDCPFWENNLGYAMHLNLSDNKNQ